MSALLNRKPVPGRTDGSHSARARAGRRGRRGRCRGHRPEDRRPVVVNPQAAPSGIIGCGGPLGGMSEYLLIQNAAAGKSVAAFPGTLPFEVAALNEPMAIARHCVNRSQARPADKVIVFGAGPSGSAQ